MAMIRASLVGGDRRAPIVAGLQVPRQMPGRRSISAPCPKFRASEVDAIWVVSLVAAGGAAALSAVEDA